MGRAFACRFAARVAGRPVFRKQPTSLRLIEFGSPLLAVAALVVWNAYSWAGTYSQAIETAQNRVSVLSEYALRLMQTQIVTIEAADRRAMDLNEFGLRSEEYHRFLAALETPQDNVYGLALIGSDGELVASSREYPASRRVDWEPVLEGKRKDGEYSVDRVKLPPSGVDSLVITKRRIRSDFDGEIVSAIGVSSLRDFLNEVTTEAGEAASFLREDGLLLLRNLPMDEPTMLPPDSVVRREIASRDSGTFELTSVVDGVTRVYAFKRLDRLPLFVNSGISKATIRDRWLRENLAINLFLASFGVFGFVFARQATRAIRARAAATAAEFDRKLLHEAEALAEQRKTMMQELSHRVKNNLLSVEALVRLQFRQKERPDPAEIVARIRAISDVHDLLHRSTDAFHVDFGTFLEQVSRNPAIIPPEREIAVVHDIESGIMVDANAATPLALVVVEVLTNAVKHAFAGRPGGTITLSLRRDGEIVQLDIADDGVGLPETPARSSGLKLIDSFVQQVDGTHETQPAEGGGTLWRFRFNVCRLHDVGRQAGEA